MTEVELGRMDLGRNQYVVSLELGIFQGRPKSIRPNSETVKIRPMAQEADSTHFFRPISVHPSHTPSALNAGAKRSGATCHMAMPQCCYLAKGAKRPSHTTNTIKFDRIPFDPCNSIKRFDLSPFDQKNSTYLQPPIRTQWFELIPVFGKFELSPFEI